jgi:hypothetical protein
MQPPRARDSGVPQGLGDLPAAPGHVQGRSGRRPRLWSSDVREAIWGQAAGPGGVGHCWIWASSPMLA